MFRLLKVVFILVFAVLAFSLLKNNSGKIPVYFFNKNADSPIEYTVEDEKEDTELSLETVGDILKEGNQHPAYKDARKGIVVADAYQIFIAFVIIGIFIGYIISLKSVFSYRSEISKLVKKNKEISEELDSLRNVAVGEEFSFTEEE
jgi:uncharacterized integral membrane protein